MSKQSSIVTERATTESGSFSKFDKSKIRKRSERVDSPSTQELTEERSQGTRSVTFAGDESNRSSNRIIKKSQIQSSLKKKYSFTASSSGKPKGTFEGKNIDVDHVTLVDDVQNVDDVEVVPESVIQQAAKFGKDLMVAQSRDAISRELIPGANIKNIYINTMSYEEMKERSELSITNGNLLGLGSVSDPRLGPASPNTACPRCGLIGCAGHPGFIDFSHMPCYAPPDGIRNVIALLNVVCNKCSKLMFTKAFLEENGIRPGPSALKQIEELALKGSVCQQGGSREDLGYVKGCGKECAISSRKKKAEIIRFIGKLKDSLYTTGMKKDEKARITKQIEKEKLKLEKISCECSEGKGRVKRCPMNFKFSVKESKASIDIVYEVEAEEKGKKPTYHSFPIEEVIKVLSKISKEDIKLLGYTGSSLPMNNILRGILVMEMSARPFSLVKNKEEPHILTKKYAEIYKAANADPSIPIEKRRVVLYEKIASLLSDKDTVAGRTVTGPQNISNLISGKKGVLRQHLGAARTGNFYRTVATADPSMRTDEIGVPENMRRILVKKIDVTVANLIYSQNLFDDGKIVYAEYSRGTFKGVTVDVKETYKKGIIRLVPGDKIYRGISNGDIIVVNRHPSLHKNSILAFRVNLTPGESTRANLAVTKGYNLDFDGDEIQGWVPVDSEVDMEVLEIMGVHNNIISDRNNQPIVTPAMNAPTFAQRLTRPGVFVPMSTIMDIYFRLTSIEPYDNEYEKITRISTADELNLSDLIVRLKRNGIPVESGKALFSLSLPRDFAYDMKGVYITDGVLVSGIINKDTIGDKHRSIVQEIHKQYGSIRAMNFVTDITIILDHWGREEGHSVGIGDCLAYDNELYISEDKDGRIIENRRQVNVLVQASAKEIAKAETAVASMYHEGMSEAEGILVENKLKEQLKGVITGVAKTVVEKLAGTNLLMQAEGGGKGTPLTMAQLSVTPGQQITKGQRMKPTLRGGKLVLSSFDPNEKTAESRGLAKHSFLQGLNTNEYFFHAKGAREGLIDTAIKTAPAGTLQRSLMKNLANIIIESNGSVSQTNGRIICFLYGNDGFASKHLLNSEYNGVKLAVPIDIGSIINYLNSKRGWMTEKQLQAMIENSKQRQYKANIDVEREAIFGPYTKFEVNKFAKLEDNRYVEFNPFARNLAKTTVKVEKENMERDKARKEKLAVFEEIERGIRILQERNGGGDLKELQKQTIVDIKKEKLEEFKEGLKGKDKQKKIKEFEKELNQKYNVNVVKTLEVQGGVDLKDRTLQELAESLIHDNPTGKYRQRKIDDMILRLADAIPFRSHEHSKFIRKDVV